MLIFLLNKPQNGDYKSALFYVLNANRDRGLVINDINLSFWNYYKPYINDNLATLVAGGGRVQFKGGFISEINGVKSNGYIVSQSLNVVFNGDAEGDNTNGWKVSGQGNFSIDKNVHKNGEGSFKIDVNSGQSLNIKQEFRVRPSQTILCQYWQKSLIRGQNTLFSVKIDFYTKKMAHILVH
ncbi:hypothetical protein QS257_18680 [Terrilactibacillus sp. S3-3]|nr:hypothetical protein QS257_18680 [Terrilactibacillus sp. S3-3]